MRTEVLLLLYPDKCSMPRESHRVFRVGTLVLHRSHRLSACGLEIAVVDGSLLSHHSAKAWGIRPRHASG
nr:hypothetical protein CFP56_08111 [Quercus suber]